MLGRQPFLPRGRVREGQHRLALVQLRNLAPHGKLLPTS